MKKQRFVSRVESSRARGWQVRFHKGRQLEHSKFFSDTTYAGKRKALLAAVSYRDKFLVKNPKFAARTAPLLKMPKPVISNKLVKRRAGWSEVLHVYLKVEPGRNGKIVANKWSLQERGKASATRKCNEWLAPWLKKQAAAYRAATKAQKAAR
jgi:hypothetical protein